MEATMAGTEDRISDFPDEILHQILSFLPIKAATQTTVLSRRWKHILDSYPVVDFSQSSIFGLRYEYIQSQLDSDFSRKEWPQYWETFEKFTKIVDDKLQKLCEYGIGIQKFKLSIALVDPEFDSFFDEWMDVVSEKHVRELDLLIMVGGGGCYVLPETIFASKCLTVLKISGFNLTLVHPVTVDLHSLRTLTLKGVYLDEDMLQNLISGCPLVEDLCLSFRRELMGDSCVPFPFRIKMVNICGLFKLANLTIGMLSPGLVPTIKLSRCQDLRRVSLHQVNLKFCVFNDVNFPQIEFISLSNITFNEVCKISSYRLKTLIIDGCRREEEKLNIFAPNLISVEHTYLVHYSILGFFKFLADLNADCNLKVCLYYVNGNLHIPWYIGLKEHLQKQKQTKTLEVFFGHPCEIVFDWEEAEKSNCLLPPHALNCLVLKCMSLKILSCLDFNAVMDSFFWCCRPQVLSTHTQPRRFIKFLFKTLKNRENEGCCSSSEIKCWRHEGCCGSSEIKCWRHSLKKVSDVVIFEYKGIEEKMPLCWDTFKKTAPENWAIRSEESQN
ncbi:hypothetical protein SLEP1_g26743 [Rubroshorea leprosula]|uniref:F-box domain-containing protein n=1 Tax=Rubroshorea leprosula TaxID=152421 RepID=A0AAV5JQX6_9ROSI|nr:hypothetical protein SLEP1_g26743 [Rubroshorea leprosula]